MENGFDFPLERVMEGKAEVYVPVGRALVRNRLRYRPSRSTVFYNPVMKLNRDVAVAILQVFQRRLNNRIDVCEPLGGSGIRSIRFSLEVEGVRSIVLNDINPRAANLARYNIEKNNLKNMVEVTNLNANLLLQEHSRPKSRFDAIDLDPFGSPAPFLDSALSALKDGGLLAVTATDMAPLCGVHPWACIRKYSAVPLRTEYCHELAMRILLGSVAVAAAHHDFGIRVLASHSTDHYIRIYVTCCYGAKRADQSLLSMGFVSHCFNCFHREIGRGFATRLPSVCPECGEILRACGPLWTGALADSEFCALILEKLHEMGSDTNTSVRTFDRISKEADAPPTYYVIDRICDKFNLPIPRTEVVMKKILEQGYKVVGTHFNPKGLKTESPARVVKEAITNSQI